MRISAKGEYALKAMLDLSLQPPRRIVPIQEIAARQGIPQRYLEQVLQALKRAGLLASRRGAAGGYQLARGTRGHHRRETCSGPWTAPQAPFEARDRGRGARRDDLGELWEEIGRAVSEVVDRLSVGELAERARARAGAQPMYHI